MRFRADFLLVVFFCAIALLYCRFSLYRGNRGKVAGKKSIEALKECLNARTIPTPILKNKYLHRYSIRKKQERRRTPCVVFVSAASRGASCMMRLMCHDVLLRGLRAQPRRPSLPCIILYPSACKTSATAFISRSTTSANSSMMSCVVLTNTWVSLSSAGEYLPRYCARIYSAVLVLSSIAGLLSEIVVI